MKKSRFWVMVLIATGIAVVGFSWLESNRLRRSAVSHLRSSTLQDLRLISNYITDASQSDPEFRRWFIESKEISSKELFVHLRTNQYVGELVFQRSYWKASQDFVDRDGNSIQLNRKPINGTVWFQLQVLDPRQDKNGSNGTYLSVSNKISVAK